MKNKIKKIVIIGGGGLLGNLINYIESQGLYKIYGYIDRINNGSVLGIKYLGNDDVLPKIYQNGIQYAVIGVGIKLSDSKLKRTLVFKARKIGFKFPAIITGNAVVHRGVKIGDGCIIRDGSIIQYGVKLGQFAMIGDNVIISHDSIIGRYSHIVAGSTIGRNCIIGNSVFIGYGSTILNEVSITNNVTVGAKSLVNRNIKNKGTYFGVPVNLKQDFN